MKSFSLSPHKHIYLYYLIIYYLCGVTLILSSNSPKNWLALLFISLIALSLLLILARKKYISINGFKRRKRKIRKIRIAYERSIELSIMASLTFFLSIISYCLTSNILYCSLFYIISTILLFFSMSTFLSEAENFDKVFKGGIVWLGRVGWIATTFMTYYYARHTFMEFADIPYEQTATRLMIVAYAAIFSTIVISASAILLFLVLIFFEKSTLLINNKVLIVTRSSFHLIFSTLLISHTSFHVIQYNISSIFNYTISNAIYFDTIDTFKCQEKQLFLPGDFTYHFFRISDEEYRAFYFDGKSLKVKRLQCIKVNPFYKLTGIKNRSELAMDKLKILSEESLQDYEKILKKHN